VSALLPKGWRRVRLDQCCQVVGGATPSRDVPEYWDGDIPWVTPKDISKLDQPVLEDAPEKITQAGYAASSTTLMPAGSILFSSRAPIGLVAIAGRKMCTNQGFKSLVPGSDVDSGFLYWTMKRNAPRIAALGNGATFKEVSKEVVSRVEIDLPPLDEQRRIAAILDKADAIRRKRQQTLSMADDFLRSAFLEMFGDPVLNPYCWPTAPLQSLIDPDRPITYGILMPGPDLPDGVPYIRVVDMNDGAIKLDQVRKTTTAISAEYRRSKLKPDDVLISIRGHVGRLAIVPECLDGANITQDTARLAVSDGVVCHHYLFRCLESGLCL
jgi:type I restriction enzyme S subunit